MTTTVENAGLTRFVSDEERRELRAAAFRAFDKGDKDAAHEFLKQIPIRPASAKFWFEQEGREFLEEFFNLSDANEAFGEGWMNG